MEEKRYSIQEISAASGAKIRTMYTRAHKYGIKSKAGYTAEEAYLMSQPKKRRGCDENSVKVLREYLERRKHEG